jgi:hypothetical protein
MGATIGNHARNAKAVISTSCRICRLRLFPGRRLGILILPGYERMPDDVWSLAALAAVSALADSPHLR